MNSSRESPGPSVSGTKQHCTLYRSSAATPPPLIPWHGAPRVTPSPLATAPRRRPHLTRGRRHCVRQRARLDACRTYRRHHRQRMEPVRQRGGHALRGPHRRRLGRRDGSRYQRIEPSADRTVAVATGARRASFQLRPSLSAPATTASRPPAPSGAPSSARPRRPRGHGGTLAGRSRRSTRIRPALSSSPSPAHWN